MNVNDLALAGTVSGPPDSAAIHNVDIRAPRYTSYPTADRFVDSFSRYDYARFLAQRALSQCEPLSLYVHVPFCESLCYYCACNKTITQSNEKADPYVQRLLEETALVNQHLGGGRKLTQMHWGGGTPTFLRPEQILKLMHGLRGFFDFAEDGELSIEIDPRAVDNEKIDTLAAAGFNRMSLGVQDFDPDVQRAVNRVQSVELTQQVLDHSRRAGFTSTNFDLIYGLPQQTVKRFAVTIETVVSMRPERIALYNYAHLPVRFKAQTLINEAELPSASEKMALFQMANEALDAAGYQYIGMDHFAVPEDELAVASREGRLQRNFQGYSTQPDCDLVALGASSISRMGRCYSQNLRGVTEYSECVASSALPTFRGVEVTPEDLLRRGLIMSIMCQGQIIKSAYINEQMRDFDAYFSDELEVLRPLEQMGFVSLTTDTIQVTEPGRRQALRVIGAVFDPWQRTTGKLTPYSRVL